jgi:hypothetical protein
MTTRQPTTRRVFDAFVSPKATFVLLALLLALISVGMFVPQQGDLASIGHNYSSGMTQLVRGFDLHRIDHSWPLQLIALLLGLNLTGLGLAYLQARNRQSSGMTPASRNRRIIGKAFNGPGGDIRVDDSLRMSLSGWQVESCGENAVARRGWVREGLVAALAGVLILGCAWIYAQSVSVQGRVWLMAGPSTDLSVQSRFRAERQSGHRSLPWKPDFELACSTTADGRLIGTRHCEIAHGGERKRVTLGKGHYIPIGDYRLTLVGARYLSGVGGFTLDVAAGNQHVHGAVDVGGSFDVTQAGAIVASLLISGNDRNDPVAVLLPPDGAKGLSGDLRVEARPRVELEFRLSSEQHEWLVWTGLALLLLGLFVALVLPGYTLMANRTGTRWTLSVSGIGLLCRPGAVLTAIEAELKARAGGAN